MNKNMDNIRLINQYCNRGSILVAVLIILSSLIILSVGLTYRTRIEMELAFAHAQRTQVYYLALGGIERIKALLSSEQLTPQIITQISQFHNSANDENLFEQVTEYSTENKRLLLYSLRDELGYLNLNKSDPASWENLNIIGRECCASILDWMDKDSDVNPDGAETDYYGQWKNPYRAKNAPFVNLKELLFIKGVTHNQYVGEDLNRNGLLDDNERDGFIKPPFDNEDAVLDYGLTDIFTVYGDGKININTANRMIISALPGLDEKIADLIESYRAGPDRIAGTTDDVCFNSPQDIALLQGLTDLQISLLQDYCCFDSYYFRIFSTAGSSNTYKCALMATVEIKDSKLKILDMERLL